MSDLFFFLRLLGLFTGQTPVKPSKNKAEKVIEKALERHMDEAAELVKEDLCTECRDRRCDRGIHCKRFDDAVKERAWELIGGENN